MGVRMVNQSDPPKNTLARHRRGLGAALISPPTSHFIGGLESVKISGVGGELAVEDENKPNGDGRTYGRTDVHTDVQDLESLMKAGPSWVRQKKNLHIFTCSFTCSNCVSTLAAPKEGREEIGCA